MKRPALTVLGATSILTLGIVIAGAEVNAPGNAAKPRTVSTVETPAANPTPGCVTKAEYVGLRAGQSPAQVTARLGTAGTYNWSEVEGTIGRATVYEYVACDTAGHPMPVVGHWVEVMFLRKTGTTTDAVVATTSATFGPGVKA